MIDLGLTDLFLTGMATYGPLLLGLALLLSPLGLPVPTGLLVLAAGAFVRQGLMEWPVAAAVGLAGTVLGDVGSYGLGRFAGDWIQRRLRGNRAALWLRAQSQFLKHGALALLSTRVLFTSLDVPTNLVAGSSHYPFPQFLAWDLLGRLGWLLLYGGLGYAFGSQWQMVSQAINDYQGWLAVLAVVGTGILILRRLCQGQQPQTA
jgi:membrane protein DedA with SNARE-associated domain